MESEGETINNGGTVLALFPEDNNMAQTNEVEQVANLTERKTEKIIRLY